MRPPSAALRRSTLRGALPHPPRNRRAAGTGGPSRGGRAEARWRGCRRQDGSIRVRVRAGPAGRPASEVAGSRQRHSREDGSAGGCRCPVLLPCRRRAGVPGPRGEPRAGVRPSRQVQRSGPAAGRGTSGGEASRRQRQRPRRPCGRQRRRRVPLRAPRAGAPCPVCRSACAGRTRCSEGRQPTRAGGLKAGTTGGSRAGPRTGPALTAPRSGRRPSRPELTRLAPKRAPPGPSHHPRRRQRRPQPLPRLQSAPTAPATDGVRAPGAAPTPRPARRSRAMPDRRRNGGTPPRGGQRHQHPRPGAVLRRCWSRRRRWRLTCSRTRWTTTTTTRRRTRTRGRGAAWAPRPARGAAPVPRRMRAAAPGTRRHRATGRVAAQPPAPRTPGTRGRPGTETDTSSALAQSETGRAAANPGPGMTASRPRLRPQGTPGSLRSPGTASVPRRPPLPARAGTTGGPTRLPVAGTTGDRARRRQAGTTGGRPPSLRPRMAGGRRPRQRHRRSTLAPRGGRCTRTTGGAPPHRHSAGRRAALPVLGTTAGRRAGKTGGVSPPPRAQVALRTVVRGTRGASRRPAASAATLALGQPSGRTRGGRRRPGDRPRQRGRRRPLPGSLRGTGRPSPPRSGRSRAPGGKRPCRSGRL